MEIQRHWFESCGTSTGSRPSHHNAQLHPQLVNKDTNATVAESHSRIRSSFFRKPRDMSLEISEVVSHAVDIILLTFILVWKERQSERSKRVDMINTHANMVLVSPDD